MFGGIIESLLIHSCKSLNDDLKKVEATWTPAKRNLSITHNKKDTLQVLADIEYKAYVPKRYHAWNVTFTEWKGDCPVVDFLI